MRFIGNFKPHRVVPENFSSFEDFSNTPSDLSLISDNLVSVDSQGSEIVGVPISNFALSSHNHSVSDITATGSADDTTYLRGDGTWAAPILNTSPTLIKSITIESPTASENFTMFFTSEAITITRITAILRGVTPSVTWTVRHSIDRTLSGNEVITGGTTTTNVTTGQPITSFDDATVPASSFIWIETTGISGTINELNLSIEYTVD